MLSINDIQIDRGIEAAAADIYQSAVSNTINHRPLSSVGHNSSVGDYTALQSTGIFNDPRERKTEIK